MITAGHDPLQSEGEAYAGALASAGVSVTHRCYQGAVHGFLTMPVLELAQHVQHQVWADISHAIKS